MDHYHACMCTQASFFVMLQREAVRCLPPAEQDEGHGERIHVVRQSCGEVQFHCPIVLFSRAHRPWMSIPFAIYGGCHVACRKVMQAAPFMKSNEDPYCCWCRYRGKRMRVDHFMVDERLCGSVAECAIHGRGVEFEGKAPHPRAPPTGACVCFGVWNWPLLCSFVASPMRTSINQSISAHVFVSAFLSLQAFLGQTIVH